MMGLEEKEKEKEGKFVVVVEDVHSLGGGFFSLSFHLHLPFTCPPGGPGSFACGKLTPSW
jgi:hypothetical protein